MAQSGAGVNGHAQEPVTISIRADAGQRDPSINRRTYWAEAGQTSCSKPSTRPHAIGAAAGLPAVEHFAVG